jgi:phosphate acetyltransferase
MVMADNLYITATESKSGKSAISLGVMEMLARKICTVGFFRPIINATPGSEKRDNDIHLIASHFKLDFPYEKMYGYTLADANNLISGGREAELIEGIIKKYDELKKTCDFVLCEGTDFASSSAAFEADINAEISKNLGSPVLLVANAYQKAIEDTIRSTDLALESLADKGCQTLATIVNRADPQDEEVITRLLKERQPHESQLVYVIPNEKLLGNPTVGEIAAILGAETLWGTEQLNRHVDSFIVAAMQLRDFLPRVTKDALIITPGDRDDVIIGCLAAVSSSGMDTIAGILLTGDLKPEEPVWNVIHGLPQTVPILSVKEDTFPTAARVDKIHAVISPDDDRKIIQALAVFEKNIDVEQLGEKITTTHTSVVTPKMFEYGLIQKARATKQHIVLPEGEEERVLKATEVLLRREVADITLLGNKQRIQESIAQLGLHLDGVNIIDPTESDVFQGYAETYFELRKHKGITPENARDVMSDVNFFGTMMIYKGDADGMVSGAIHSTAATVRAPFEIVKTKPGFSIVSSVFLMCLSDRVLVYGDCAVNPNPNASQLAEIALSSAQTAKTFGIDPVVAMLSYSTGESGKGEDVDRVREATNIAQERAKAIFPGLKIEGPIQYDAAIDPSVAETKMPRSEVAGKATVFIFPDLNTGNNTYKAVQRSAGAVAIGPVLQGLKCPVNDLSRGCTVPDIVNTVAITAIQAQSEKIPQ